MILTQILGRRGPPKSFKDFFSLAQYMNKVNPRRNWSSDILIIEAKKVYRGNQGEKDAGESLMKHKFQVIGECLALK